MSNVDENNEENNDPFDEDNLDEDNLPSGYSIMSASAEDIDYLKAYWELRDTGQMFGWALRLLHDLSKLDEAGWLICLQKATHDEVTGEINYDTNYKTAAFRLKAMMPPGKHLFVRLPSVEELEILMNKNKQDKNTGDEGYKHG